MSSPSVFVQTFVTVLVVMDPVGNVPVFLTLTRAETPARRRVVAAQATALAAGVIFAFAIAGERVLAALGISLAALQVAGGLLLALVALELLHPFERAEVSPNETRNLALVPLGTPLLAGPGAIAVTMVQIRAASDLADRVWVFVALACVLAVVLGVFVLAGQIHRLLSDDAVHVLTRVMGLLVSAIAVQLVAEGVQEWVRNGV